MFTVRVARRHDDATLHFRVDILVLATVTWVRLPLWELGDLKLISRGIPDSNLTTLKHVLRYLRMQSGSGFSKLTHLKSYVLNKLLSEILRKRMLYVNVEDQYLLRMSFWVMAYRNLRRFSCYYRINRQFIQ